MKLRLFALRDVNHQMVKENGNVVYFSSKEEARRYRTELTGGEHTHFVTYGVDHKLYKGDKK
jgi:hypothetical protein